MWFIYEVILIIYLQKYMKMKNLSLLLLTLTLFFTFIYSQNIAQTQMVYRWPETYCNRGNPKGGCNQTPPLNFTLVGFWGTNANGEILQGCRDTQTHDWKKVLDTDLVDKLTLYWPSLTKQDPIDMWKEAWNTYGTCLTQRFKGPTQYFNRAARLSEEIKDLLHYHLIAKDGIVPCDSATYTKVEILNSFKQVTKQTETSKEKDVSFTCEKINATHAYLNKVTFCYTNDAKSFTNCPTSTTRTRCEFQNIIVPRPSPPTKSFVSIEALQTGEKFRPNSLWEILRQLV